MPGPVLVGIALVPLEALDVWEELRGDRHVISIRLSYTLRQAVGE
jgi:hypothetical protein